jgi:hypothetical protein
MDLKSFLTPGRGDFNAVLADRKNFDRLLERARNLPMPTSEREYLEQRFSLSPDYRNFDRWVLEQAKKIPVPMNARQYFNSTLADSLIVAASITPTTTKTSILTPAQALQCWPLPYGLAAPFAGQIFRFACGGLITTPATGTLIIDPYHGPGSSATVFGTDMGASAAQTVTASLASQPWFLEGYLVYRSISAVSTTSTAWLTGTFTSQGTLATAGGGWSISFGSTAAVSVDTTGLAANLFGALNIAVTFSVTGATIIAEWTSMQSLN